VCLLKVLISTGCQTFPLLLHRDIATRETTTVVVFGRTFLRYDDIGSRMAPETALTAAAIIGLVVALLQLLIWAFKLIQACIRYIQRTYQPLKWATRLIYACHRCVWKRRKSQTTTRNDVEMAILKPSSEITNSTSEEYVLGMVVRTCRISCRKGHITTNTHDSGVATQGSHKDSPPTSTDIQATGLDNPVVAHFLRQRSRHNATACDRCYCKHKRVYFARLRA